MWYRSEITKKLGVQYPIIQAGMAGGVTTPELVAAVSNSGALGTLGAGYMTPETMQQAIKQIKQLTDQPFAVNLFIPEIPNVDTEAINQANEWLRPYREALQLTKPEVKQPSSSNYEKQLEILLQEGVPICSFTFGVPDKETIQKLKQHHLLLIGTATTVQEAMINEVNGMDMVVMQGSEAGGHRGTFLGEFEDAMIGTMALVPQAVDQVSIPVIAAGGIMDGRGILAALTLGAQAVQMGTAFLTCLESGAKKQHKEAILHTTEEQPVITSAFSGKPARGIKNQFITKMAAYEEDLPSYPIQNALTKEIRREAANQNRPEWMHLWSGQGPRLSRQQAAGEMISKWILQIDERIK
ncbi:MULTISPECIES: NAD(P)H-dependent flavin oxidoreductase [Virgibacillus]|uniref:NAD(P)H-dependent flavin oxidoreductase n=1 Tax=Virgibacillus TaxID=84406 RepID=UPI00038878C3|nr:MULTISPECIES: nitronate monooxygenase [Virgibacillus]EQB37631.1 hypothetical protein M948_03510 [Virgibacillus sp. CM-4]